MSNKTKPIAGLMRTTDYSIFDTHEFNRPLKDKPALEESMRVYGFMISSPIQCVRGVDGKLKIIRGHHRLRYAQQLKLPVYYVIDESNTDIHSLEGDVNQSWSTADFLYSIAKAGNDHYLMLDEFCRSHKIQLSIGASMLGGQSAGSGNKIKTIKSGEFKTTPEGIAHATAVITIADAFAASGAQFARQSAFLSAVSAAIQVPELDAGHLASAAAKHGHVGRRRGTMVEYLEEIEVIYNRFRKPPLLPVRVRAIEEAMRRGKKLRK